MKKILCCRPWGIGNMINCTPALRALKKLYPDSQVDILSTSLGLDIIRGCKEINNYYTEEPPYTYDIIIRFHPGTTHYNCWNGKKIIRRETDDYSINEMESNLDLIAKLGNIGDYDQYEPFVEYEKDENIMLGYQLLKSKGICINTGCTKGNEMKKWDKWDKLIIKLLALNYMVIVVGGEKNTDISKKILDKCVNYSGKLSIQQTAGVIKACDMMISIDSGLMHIACVLGVKTIGLFGGTCPVKNRPYKQTYIWKTVCKKQPCYGVNNWGDCKEAKCIKAISVDDVMEKVEERL